MVDTDRFNQYDTYQRFCALPDHQRFKIREPQGIHGTVIGLVEMQSALPGGGKVGGLAPPKLVQ